MPPGADGTPATKDFHQGMLGNCFVASAVMGRCRSAASRAALQPGGPVLRHREPTPFAPEEGSIVGGKIALQRTAKVNLEMALLADGVPGDRGLQPARHPKASTRAFAKLDTIKHNIVWWGGAKSRWRSCGDGEVQVATALTGEVHGAMAGSDLDAAATAIL